MGRMKCGVKSLKCISKTLRDNMICRSTLVFLNLRTNELDFQIVHLQSLLILVIHWHLFSISFLVSILVSFSNQLFWHLFALIIIFHFGRIRLYIYIDSIYPSLNKILKKRQLLYSCNKSLCNIPPKIN